MTELRFCHRYSS